MQIQTLNLHSHICVSILLSLHPSMAAAFLSRRIPLLFVSRNPCFRSPIRPPFSVHFCSSHSITTQTPLPPIPHFLLTECHFSEDQISQITQTTEALLKTSSPHIARDAVEFLKQWGFTQSQLHKTILTHPVVLDSKVDTVLKPKFDFFRTLGFTDQELINLISSCPRVLGNNLENEIIPRISFLETLFGTKPNLIKALKRAPTLLVDSIEENLKPRLDLFKQWGIQGELLSLLLSKHPDSLVRWSTENLSVKMEYALNTMGIASGSKTFVYAIVVLLSNRPQTVEKKMKHLQCLGFMEDEVRELLKNRPGLLACSTSKMEENMHFLTQTAGLNPKDVFSNSFLLQLSVRKRLIPRHAVFKALSSEQQSVLSLPKIFNFTDKRFLAKIVKCNPQASVLKEIYKGKMKSADSGTM